MELFIHKFVTVSPRKILGKNSSEIHFAGTNLFFPFLKEEDNSKMDSKYGVSIKEIKLEIDTVKKTSKTVTIKNGEPCLQQLGLKSLADYIQKQNMYVALETYGTKPNVLRELVDNKLVDTVTLKLYFPLQAICLEKMSKESLLTNKEEIVDDIKKSIDILKKAKVNVHVRTIIVPSLIYKKADICRIARAIKDIPNCIYEIVSFEPNESSKLFSKVKKPSEEFLDDIKNSVREMYPSLQIR